ncbi:uncharacterized protein TrAtP1_010703 [Trichoderma atroviride]|nr:hypothetical protein TrAtP1_010703 [Trichoderma atroviride]
MKERGHQVEQMSKIYSEAERVIFWLGPGTVETDMLMESLRVLQHESIHHHFGDWSLQDDRWKNLWACMETTFESFHKKFRTLQREGLRQLLARPWFRRVWILQEVALAKAGIIVCGRKNVSARLFGLIPLFLEIKPDPHSQSVLDIMPSPWRKTSWWSKSPNLRTLLSSFGDSEATEPRDLVYALRGMSSDAAEKDGIIPDYDKSEENLVREVVQFVEHCELEGLPLETRPRSVRNLIKCLRALDLGRCMALAKRSSPHEIEMFLEKSKVRVNQEIFTTAVACDNTGEVVEILLRYRQREFILDDTILLPAAKNEIGAKGVFEVLFRYARGQITISDKALIAVAGNELCGDGIFEVILRYQGDRITIPEGVLAAAVENKQCGDRIIKVLARYREDKINLLANVSANALITAMENKQRGIIIFEALIRCLGDYIKISDEVLIKAAENEQYGDEIFIFLFHYQGYQIRISEGVLTAAAGNERRGDRIFEFLLRYLKDKTLNILLSQRPDLANFSKEIAITAAKNKGCGDRIINTLLSHRPDLAIFSENGVS